MRFYHKILLVDEIARKGSDHLSNDHFPSDSSGEYVLVLRFLDKVKGSKWLPYSNFLTTRFSSTEPHELTFVGRFYLAFLKTCLDKPELVATELATHIPNEDYSWSLWLQVYLGLPTQARGKLLDSFIQKWPSISGDRVRREVQDVAVDLLKRENINDTVSLLNTVLAFYPQPENEVQEYSAGTGIFRLPEPAPRFSVHEYQELLDCLSKQAPADPRSVPLPVLVSTLCSAIELSIPEDEKSERSGEDGSTYWRPAIEPHEQNHDYGHREQLVTAIRDISESVLKHRPEAKSEIDSLLSKYTWFVFRRLRLHLLRKFPELFKTEIHAALLDSELRHNSSIWHEWALLFSEQFKNMDPEDQGGLLAWIERGDDLQTSIQFYQERHDGEKPSLEIQAGWQAHWQLRRLTLIENDLTSPWKRRLEELRSKYDDVDEPDLLHSMSGGGAVPVISPITADQLQTMSADGIAAAVQDWVQTDRFDGPSEWGLREALKQDAKRDPGKFLNDLGSIWRLSTDRLVTVLSACFEAGNEGAPLDWPQFLTFIEKVTKERILPEANKVDPETGYLGTGIDLIRNLETGLEKQPSRIPTECRGQVWKLILLFLQHPEPREDRKRGKTGPFDLISESLNSSRGVAVRCIFIYANWRRRQTEAGGRENPPVEILKALEDRLLHDEALSIRAIFGERFSWLLHFHREWTMERIPQIFPSDPGSALKKAAAWDSFLVYAQVSDSLFEAMAPYYREAVKGLSGMQQTKSEESGQHTPTKGLVHHLMALYWFGTLPIEGDPLLKEFYQVAPVWLRAYSLEYIGRSLSNTKGEVPPLVAKRFVELAEWRIAALKAQPEPDRQELEGFFAWVPSLKLDEDWLFPTTYSVLQLIGKWTSYHHHSLIDPLAAYSKKKPLLAVQCLAEMLKREEGYGLWGNEEEIKAILRNARDSDSETAIRLHEDVQDALLRKNQLQFMDLDEKKSS